MSYIPYGRQDIQQADIDALIEVLQSDWLTQGPMVAKFEKTIADYCGAQFAIAVCNATAALHLACRAFDLQPGDWVWTTPNTFVASANCALYCGAHVDFVDICPNTYNMSVEVLKNKLLEAEKIGKLPKIIIPVHFAGQSCDMAEIKKLSHQYGFKIIEDASHAVGGTYLDQPIGSCQYSDVAIFSFHPVKIITTGEGGMCLTNDEKLAQQLALLRTHGITRDPLLMTQKSEGDWYYQQLSLGYNYRITDIQCALGVSQMTRLDSYVERRNVLAQQYHRFLASLPLKLPTLMPNRLNAYHLYVVQVFAESKTRAEVFKALRNKKIGVNVHYIPVHLQPYYQQLGFKKGDFPVAEAYYERAISLPMFPTLSDVDQRMVCDVLSEVLG